MPKMRTFLKQHADRIVDVLHSISTPGSDPNSLPPGFTEVTDDPLPPGVNGWDDIAGRKRRANGTFEPPAASGPNALQTKLDDIIGRLNRGGLI